MFTQKLLRKNTTTILFWRISFAYVIYNIFSVAFLDILFFRAEATYKEPQFCAYRSGEMLQL